MRNISYIMVLEHRSNDSLHLGVGLGVDALWFTHIDRY